MSDVPETPDVTAPPVYCSFCGKHQDDVERIIAGRGVYICDECTDLCNDIISEGREEDQQDGGVIYQRNQVRRTVNGLKLVKGHIRTGTKALLDENDHDGLLSWWLELRSTVHQREWSLFEDLSHAVHEHLSTDTIAVALAEADDPALIPPPQETN